MEHKYNIKAMTWKNTLMFNVCMDESYKWRYGSFRMYVVCPKSKCTGFLFNFQLDLPEITSYLVRSM